ncbi:hypothetical protein, partial [Saccharomonospora iraqiensis]|uniref:hypothetical protein n=1 Tax=Saccharomonospora iraqiensis TaxID=52698 RepID=UPI00022DFCEB
MTDDPTTPDTGPGPDHPVFHDPDGRRRIWLRLTAAFTAGGGAAVLGVCGLLLSGQPAPVPTTVALVPE